MKNFSFKTRKKNAQALKQQDFDLLIIGGGITGAGVARDAAMRGFKVALVEANDFSYGTSSRSSKLVHGGIRYLENLEFKLVFEALSERTKLFEIAPHLTHPLRFMIPLYKKSRVSMFKMGLGMLLYDALALFQAPEQHERLSQEETLDRMSILNSQDLVGSYVYSDGYMDDDRLVHETLRSANEYGAFCVNYTEVKSAKYENGKVHCLQVEDKLSGEIYQIKAHHVISTVGPWTDLVGAKLVDDWKKILRPTKGVHLTFSKERIPLTSAVVMAAEKSNRIVFAIPRHEMVIVGTTDTDYNLSPDQVSVTREDVEYLLQITNQYFPGSKLKEEDILSSYAGVRPLVHDGSATEGKTSREHTIMHDQRGFTFVAGGKYTTYRKMSEEIVDQIYHFFPIEKKASLKKCQTEAPLNIYTSESLYRESLNLDLDEVDHLLAVRYGSEYKQIRQNFSRYTNYWQLEAAQSIHHTMCMNLIDFFHRRVPLFLAYKDHGLSLLNEIATVFQQEMNLSSEEVEKQKADLQNHIKKELSWRV